MSLLALDLGTTTGFAISNRHGLVVSGTMNFKPRKFDSYGIRFMKFTQWLDELHAADPVTEVVFEAVRRHIGTDAAHIYGGFMSHLTSWCEQQTPKIEYEGISVQDIKKHATGKGNADKFAVMAAVRSWGYNVEDDNHADALALLHLRLARLLH